MASKPICPVDIFTPWRWFSTSLISCPLSCEQSHPAHIHWCDLMCITSSMAWCLTPLQSRTKKKQHHLRLTKSQGFYFIWLFYFGSVMLTTFYFHCIEYTHIQYVYMCPRRKKQRQKLSDDLEPCIACFHDKTCFFSLHPWGPLVICIIVGISSVILILCNSSISVICEVRIPQQTL